MSGDRANAVLPAPSDREPGADESRPQPGAVSECREVVYVLGYGRSGTTVLDVLLGNAPGLVSVGELDFLHRDWEQSYCSCGNRFPECEFWTGVGRTVKERAGDATAAAREKVLRRVERLSSLPALWLGLLPRGWKRAYREQVRAELDGVAASGGAETVVDSSKSARDAAGRATALERIAGIPVRRIHMVRDGRAVLWSIRRGPRLRQGKQLERPTEKGWAFPAARAISGWILANFLAFLSAALAPPGRVLLLRYEDLMERTDAELERIGEFLGCDLGDVRRRFRDGGDFRVGHKTGGNPMVERGPLRLRHDREWESRLRWTDEWLFWLAAWPLALPLGYRPRRRRGPEDDA